MKLNPELVKLPAKDIKDIIERVTKAVPFTQSDLIDLQQAQQVNPNSTLQDVLKKTKAGKSAADFFK